MTAMLLLAAAVAAAAQALPATPPMKMGLWETESATKMNILGMPAAMAGMANRTVKVRGCVTPESYAKYVTAAQQRKDCEFTNTKWSNSSYTTDLSCNKGRMTGHTEITFDSTDAAHGTSHIETDGGKGMTGDSTLTMHYLGSDCGSITPDKPLIVK